ncbi:MATE family efflux transporter [Craterilacuibacter sp. RT1T]|uniref:MATE family efflux transporter n=1 Tax=Craterilacuibacter sp. RT1T TaxID=2942211 RepID=UPI0020C11A6C|nr:MATE family efflux transporter [Craterilacuibacter sp. RT1T]MCL6262354.1 MATE family efflux transporter [Craterilacuibacter sp. RT1T]
MLFELNRAPRGAISREARSLIHLALPMMIAQVAQVATGFVDTVMAGNVSTDDLAAVSLGSSIFVTAYVTLMGVVAALNPILSHQFGSGEHGDIGETGRQGLWFGLFAGILGMVAMIAVEPLLRLWLTLPEHVEDMTMLYITGAALGMPAALLHRSLHAYASSLNRPRPIMLVSLIALALNIPLNYILIHGLYGMPQMGGAGCGWATAIVFWFNAIALYIYIARAKHFKPYGLTERMSWPDFKRYAGFLKLGIPIGLSFFVEVSLFSFIALLVAKLGTLVVASHQAVLNFSSIIYMLPQSLSVALSVRVGQAVGAGDYLQARFVSGVGLVTGLIAAIITMVLVLLLREPIIRMYTNDPQVIAIGLTLLLFAAVYQLTDAAQTIASGALRGYKLTTIPMFIHIVSFWILGLGLGIVLGLTNYLVPAMGVNGFWAALVVSLSVAAFFLVWYLARESRQRLHRQHLAKIAP